MYYRGTFILCLLGGAFLSALGWGSSLRFQKRLNELNLLPPERILAIEDIHYCNGGGHELLANLYRSKAFLEKQLHAIIFIHDDILSGTRDQEAEILAKIAAARGYVGVTIDYRLSGTSRTDYDPNNDRLQVGASFPDALLDVRCAVRWLRAYSEEFGLVPGRVTLFGMGSGGYLALMAGLTGETRKLPKSGDMSSLARSVTNDVRSVIAWSAPTDALSQYWYEHSNRNTGKRELSTMIAANPIKKRKLFDLASPMDYIGDESAPIYAFHGTIDQKFPFDTVTNFSTEMETRGVPHTLIPVPGVGYEFADKDGRIHVPTLKRVIDHALELVQITQRHDPIHTIQKEQERVEREQKLKDGGGDDDWW